MFYATKYRIYPCAEQKKMLAQHFGCVRYVYNRALSLRKEAWEKRKENITRFDLSALLPVWKRQNETKWLADVNAQSLQASIANLEIAYTNFFRDKKGFPKFKSKNDRQSFQVPQRTFIESDVIQIPKVGNLFARVHRPILGKIKTMTISLTTSGQYYASVLSETDEQLLPKMPITEEGTIGIDLGIKHFATLSTGEKIENPRPLKKRLRRLQRAQRKLSRRKNGSANRRKQRRIVAKIYKKISDIRKDFLHKLTDRLVNENQVDTLAIENLAVKNMTRNHHLAQAIGDASWGEFRRQLEYKAERIGKNILIIGRFEPSSKTCSCGQINNDLKLSDRIWTCDHCGASHDRDILAAQNIKRFALHPQNKQLIPPAGREFTPVETDNSRSIKQEALAR